MKIRTDFVTNSSSSSFVTYQINSKEIADFLRKLGEEGKGEWNDHVNSYVGNMACSYLEIDEAGVSMDMQQDEICFSGVASARNLCRYVAFAINCFFAMNQEEKAKLIELLKPVYENGQVVCGTRMDYTDGPGNPFGYDASASSDGYYDLGLGVVFTGIIPQGVPTIVRDAFSGCTNLTTITIPNSVTGIQSRAFKDCTNLTTVTIPDSVTWIGEGAFSGCTSLTTITIPNSVTEIQSRAFKDCTNLTTVTIPDSLTTIESEAFSRCTNLTAVTIPDSVTTIEYAAFSGCTNLTTITIPDSVTTIGRKAFSGCTNLTAVTIPDSVTTIEYEAFSGCTNLTAVTIPDSVTTIDQDVFLGTKWLEEYPEDLVIVGNGILIKYKGNDKNVVIPDSVTTIEYGAFSGCTHLTAVTIPDSVTTIEYEAFSECTNLTAVTIPDSVTTIEHEAFSGCTSLNTVSLSNSLTTIDEDVFSECTNLTAITIPDSVTTIERGAFSGCTNLSSIEIINLNIELGFSLHTGSSDLSIVYNGFVFDKVQEFIDSKRELGSMLETKNFTARLYTPLKNIAIIEFYLKTGDPDAEAFIKKGITRLFKFLIENDGAEVIKKLLATGKFITKKNIDKQIDYAKETGRTEIESLLLEYKEQNFK